MTQSQSNILCMGLIFGYFTVNVTLVNGPKLTLITLVTVRTMSVEVMSLSGVPDSLYPTTSGSTMLIGWPSITASASIPPTPEGHMTNLIENFMIHSSKVLFGKNVANMNKLLNHCMCNYIATCIHKLTLTSVEHCWRCREAGREGTLESPWKIHCEIFTLESINRNRSSSAKFTNTSNSSLKCFRIQYLHKTTLQTYHSAMTTSLTDDNGCHNFPTLTHWMGSFL